MKNSRILIGVLAIVIAVGSAAFTKAKTNFTSGFVQSSTTFCQAISYTKSCGNAGFGCLDDETGGTGLQIYTTKVIDQVDPEISHCTVSLAEVTNK